MHHIATLSRRPAVVIAAVVVAAVSRWSARWQSAWHELTMDTDERFIRGACDLADLEWRLQRLERGRSEGLMTFPPDA